MKRFVTTPVFDEQGSSYGFAFGLNWKGVINDVRTKKYKIEQNKR